jgi:hypothetical protein
MGLIKRKSKDMSSEMEMGEGKPQSLAISYNMKKKARKMAEGGVIQPIDAPEPGHEPLPAEDHESDDMVSRVMKKRMYSKGGMIANEDSGESASSPDEMAKDQPNEFDDLALRDDLSFSYTDENSGDEHGSKLNQEEDDMISRIMRKRSMK